MDLRHAARGLARKPAVTFALLCTIGVGLGGGAAVDAFFHGFVKGRGDEPPAGLGPAPLVVFCIACVNVAALWLGRASARGQETAIRVALGASRARLARAAAADSVLVAAIGAALGGLLASWTSRIIPALLFSEDAEKLVFAPDVGRIAAVSAVGAAILVACGLLPLLEVRWDRPAIVLGRRDAGRTKASKALRAGLMVSQMACCCFLVISTALVYGGFRAALETGAGRRLGPVVLARMQVHPDVEVDVNYFRKVEAAAGTIGGVAAKAWMSRPPGSREAWEAFRVAPPEWPRREVRMDAGAFTAAAFALPPRAGRLFGLRDGGCRVAVVNEEAAALFGGDAVGQSVRDAAGRRSVIIGVVAPRKKGGRPAIYYNDADAAGRIAGPRFSLPAGMAMEKAELDTNVVSAGYFVATGAKLTAGQIFADDAGAGGCRVAVVNAEAAGRYFGGKALGAAVIDDAGRRTEIIGVVQTARLGTFERETAPAIYYPMAQDCQPAMTLMMAARAASPAVLAAVRGRLGLVPGSGAAPVVKTLAEQLTQTALAPLHIATVIMSACAAMAVWLSVVGLYGALSDEVRRGRRDLAIRVALGARRRHVVAHVVRNGGRLAAAGSLGGMLGARVLPAVAPGITAGRPEVWVWIAGPMVLAAAVAVASVVPARRALMADPVRVLRDGG